MTYEIAIVFTILGAAILLFVTEWVRVDLVALMVLVSLAITGLVTPAEAVSGFSNPAVVTVWAVLILSAALSRTGVANAIGKRLVWVAGLNQVRLTLIIMLTTGLLSGFMNDIGVVALMLPVVIDIAHKMKIPPSKLLMPLAFASLLGGLNTLIGTPPNILVSEIMREYGLSPFKMFDYTPVGLILMTSGIIFMVLLGRRLLPLRDIGKELSASAGVDLGDFFALEERLFILELPQDSSLVRKTIAESRLGAALGLNVIALIGDGGMQLAPAADTVLQPGQKLLASGRLDRLAEVSDNHFLQVEEEGVSIDRLFSQEIILAEVVLHEQDDLVGQTVEGARLRESFGLNLLAVNRAGVPRRTQLQSIVFEPGDILLLQGASEQWQAFHSKTGLPVEVVDQVDVYSLQERLFALHVPQESPLVGTTLGDSRLRDAFGLSVLGVTRQGETRLVPTPDEELMVGDILLVEGKPEDISALRGLQELGIGQVSAAELSALETEQVGMAEVVLSPHTNLAGKTLRQIHFREKYGLSVLAIWREGRAFRSNLRDMALKFGDSLLVHGLRQKLVLLGSEPDFLVLTQSAQQVQRTEKAPLALAVMLIVLLPVIFGWLPIVITAVMGAVLMVLTGSLTMEEAYRSIEWKAIFLIAGVLPLGLALERTGAANLLAEGIVSMIGVYGPLAVTAGLFILAALSSQVMPNPAVAVLLAPIAYNTARDLGISPYPLLMTVAVSASAAFLSPVGHAANILIMGPGGYRFKDYLKVGLPLTVVVLVVLLLVLPVFWPY